MFESLAALTLPNAIKHARDMGDGVKKPKPKGVARKASEEAMEHVPADAKPTDLISTQHVERRLGVQGEVMDMKTAEADRRTPMTPQSAEDAPAVVQPVVAHGKFVPTEAWLQAVKAELPLNTIMRLLKHLVPQIEEMSAKHVIDEKVVVDFLHSTTMVGLLPVPHPIVIRKYQPNKYTCLWFTAFLWGVVFTHNQSVALFDGKKVKLFIVQHF